MKYRIGTRGSALARIQAESVRARLAAEYPQHEFEIVPIATAGDRMQDRPFSELGESAPFVREIELALIERRVDLAVHSMKDLAGECAKGLVLSKAWKRDDPRDALVLREGAGIPLNGKVATGSARRSFLLRKARPDVEIVSMRGRIGEICKGHEGVVNSHGVFIDLEAKEISFDVTLDFSVADKLGMAAGIKKEVEEAFPGFSINTNCDTNYSD
jgi:hydroxymethylbilane synthase